MTLEILVFLGSERDSTPPHPARLGLRVARACMAGVERRGMRARLVDPLEIALERPFKPHFAYAAGRAPAPLERLAGAIAEADGYVMVSAEYNHSMSPALAHLLNHFGSSRFAWKPSAIATYSAGQWGGTRAAVAMRSFLGELGCLPVSAMIHVPKAGEVLAEDGSPAPGADAAAWAGYLDRTLAQLQWWGAAARRQRDEEGADARPAPFTRSPQERNAP